MATCPECDFEIDIDEYDVDKGDTLECDNCGERLEVVSLNPIELEVVADEDDEEEKEDELDDEDEEEDEDEDEDWEQ
jgi:alpha-aminoadipate/glutamate carrier protein LysW